MVSQSKLKAKMFEYFRELELNGGEIIVTDYGKPVLKIARYQEKLNIDTLFNDIRPKARFSKESTLESTVEEWIGS